MLSLPESIANGREKNNLPYPVISVTPRKQFLRVLEMPVENMLQFSLVSSRKKRGMISRTCDILEAHDDNSEQEMKRHVYVSLVF